MRFQHFGIHRDGSLAFAGISEHRAATIDTAKTIARRWVTWATNYVARTAGTYPLSEAIRSLPVNPVVEVRMHPVGRPEACQSFRFA